MNDANDLGAFWDLMWAELRRGVADANGAARLAALATVTAQGRPRVRTVALRAASRAAGRVEVQTDIVTPKVAQLRQTPWAELMFWLPEPEVQIRLSCQVQIETGAAVVDKWHAVPLAARVSYGTRPDPGTEIDHVHAYEKPPEPDRFAVLNCDIHEVDLVQLGARHRRARYLREDCWAGVWLAP